MSWCDKLASTPTVGITITPHFVPIDVLLGSLSPIMDKMVKGETLLFSVDQPASAFSSGFTTQDGFKYAADHHKLSITFQHRIRARSKSGGPPTMEMLSRPLPFTELLPQVSAKLTDAALLLPEIKNRTLERVGIVATTAIASEDIPPGINRFIEYLGRPWKGQLSSFNVQIVGEITKTEKVYDRCVHTLVKPEDTDQLMTLMFDFQRTFTAPRRLDRDTLRSALHETELAALAYFEELAEGSQFDEELLSVSTRL